MTTFAVMSAKDIANRTDIELLVNAFYKKAIPDAVIGHFFTGVLTINWEVHIPVIVDFWENILLGTGSYKGNPMDKHFALNKLSPLEPVHFTRWLMLWKETVNELYAGPVADNAISRAITIAGLMEHKMQHSN
ncbi:MAG TPA: group III truncated hemoglobin [Bacteroidia bacterium]|nr:group III truncated hemoglobin [Bacteroidia bacterium]